MCGRFNVLRHGRYRFEHLYQELQVNGPPVYTDDAAPGSRIGIIRQPAQYRISTVATWWLLLDRSTCKPVYKYASFNSRSDRLHDPRGIAFHPYRESRCLIPASAFCEGLGDGRTYHMIELQDRPILFGGLCQSYSLPDGGHVYAASIITLPPHPAWAHVHPKSMPLMIDHTDADLVRRWLDPGETEVDQFEPLLQPRIWHPQVATPIGRPSRWDPVGDGFVIPAE